MIQKSIYRTHRCDINSMSPLFYTFNRGTHCHAGKFTIAQLLAIVLESPAIQFIHRTGRRVQRRAVRLACSAAAVITHLIDGGLRGLVSRSKVTRYPRPSSWLRAPWFGPVGVRCSSSFADNPQLDIQGADAQPTGTSSTAGQHFPDYYASQARRSGAHSSWLQELNGVNRNDTGAWEGNSGMSTGEDPIQKEHDHPSDARAVATLR
jgi:hypothetical protein